MHKRFVSISFPFLVADWMTKQHPELKKVPFVLFVSERGRMVIRSVSKAAHAMGIFPGMLVADCRAVFPDITVLHYPEGKAEHLLQLIAEWCIRFTPITAIDLPDGLVLDSSGCTHLWGGDTAYLEHLFTRLKESGYHATASMADTVACAWAMARYGKPLTVVPSGEQLSVLLDFPPAALRIETTTTDRLEKLGLITIGHFACLSRPALRRRFGQNLLTRLDQAAGDEAEFLQPVQPPKIYLERLPCLEPICTAKGIEIAIAQLLEKLCQKLTAEGKGLRNAVLRCHRVDGDIQSVTIGTNLPTRNQTHLSRLFELKTGQLQPDLGFELFELEAGIVEPALPDQSALWMGKNTGDTPAVAELLDKITGKCGKQVVHRYLPAEHYWPERSFKQADSIHAVTGTEWRTDMPRPVHLLKRPELIDVTVPLPDYPPMLFRYRGKLHQVKKADGPERIEQEWWLNEGKFRDYYCIEDESGQRYWLFRAGPYDEEQPHWYMHGFFA